MVSKNLKQLLILLNDRDFHSETNLTKLLKLAPSSICKLIKEAKKLDIEIETKTNCEYRIPYKLEFLDKEKICHYLLPKYKQYSDKIIIFDEIASTNTYLIELIKNDSNLKSDESICCLAEMQTQGRGRLGRHWFSPYARNIYLSLAYKFPKEPDLFGGLSIVTAICVINALEKYGINQGLKIKWPNDILWEKSKLAGILIDICSKTHTAVIGIGINVNMPNNVGKLIEQAYTDIKTITNTIPLRNKLIGLILNELLEIIPIYQVYGLSSFLKRWRELDITYGKNITLYITREKKVSGISHGINEKGHLILEDEFGKMNNFFVGGISQNHFS